MNELESVREIIISAVKEASVIMMEAHGIIAEAKSGKRDVVTEYDRKIQLFLESRLRERAPGAEFFCEEMGHSCDLNAAHVFIIDPIDGTMNFVHGMHSSCISVGYARYGIPSVGVVYDPYMDELFSAVLGGGAALNGAPIHASEAPLSDTLLSFGSSPYNPELADATFTMLRRLYTNCLDIRRCGSAALDLCSVAAGRVGAYFEMQLSLWDYAAGLLIVQEAGGTVTHVDGSPVMPLSAEKGSILAAGSQAMRDFRRLVDN